MATPFSQVRPTAIKLKAQLRYPASFAGQDSLVAELSHGTVTIRSNYEALTPTGGVLSPSTGYFKGWDSVTGAYYRVSYSEITAGSVAAAASAAAAQTAAEAAEAGAQAALADAQAIVSTGVLDVTAGTGVTVTGTTRHPVVNATATVRGPNLLPNTNWQLFSGFAGNPSATSAMKADGTGYQNSVVVSSFSVTNNQPTCLTSNTQDLYENCLVVFGSGLGGFSGWALRAFGIVPNTSFKVQMPFITTSPGVSSAITAFPMGIGDAGTSSGGPDGWSKTSSLIMWADDFATNRCPGAVRVMGLRKGITGTENFYCTFSSDLISKIRGRTVTLGAMVRCKVGGTTSRLFINDGVNAATLSNVLTGSGFVDAANNNYEFVSVTQTISFNATSCDFGLSTSGNAGEIYYFGIPTLKYGSGMSANDLGQMPNEHIHANAHWNPPSLVPLAKTFPASELIAGSGLYGWAGLDIEALSYGQCHSSIRKVNAKIESTCATVNQIIFVGAMKGDLVASVPLTFGLQTYTQIAGKEIDSNMNMVPLRVGPSSYGSPPGCFVIFGNLASTVITALTFDFDDVMA